MHNFRMEFASFCKQKQYSATGSAVHPIFAYIADYLSLSLPLLSMTCLQEANEIQRVKREALPAPRPPMAEAENDVWRWRFGIGRGISSCLENLWNRKPVHN